MRRIRKRHYQINRRWFNSRTKKFKRLDPCAIRTQRTLPMSVSVLVLLLQDSSRWASFCAKIRRNYVLLSAVLYEHTERTEKTRRIIHFIQRIRMVSTLVCLTITSHYPTGSEGVKVWLGRSYWVALSGRFAWLFSIRDMCNKS